MSQTHFKEDWLTDPDYVLWLSKVKDDDTAARCKLCKSTFKLSTMGQSSLTDHANGKKHKKHVKKVEGFFKKPSNSTLSTFTSGTQFLLKCVIWD